MIKNFLFATLLVLFTVPLTLANETPTFKTLTTLTMPQKYTMSVIVDNQSIKFMVYEGEFAELSAYNFNRLLRAYSDIKYIIFNSTGGDLDQARRIGVKIRENHIGVIVPEAQVCMSACAFLALYSDNIIIDGLLGFHLPYNPGYSRNKTLYEISQSSVANTLQMSRDFFINGFKLYLYYKISEISSNELDAWLTFTDENELNKFRFTDPAEFMDRVDNANYIIGSSEDMLNLIQEQKNK